MGLRRDGGKRPAHEGTAGRSMKDLVRWAWGFWTASGCGRSEPGFVPKDLQVRGGGVG